MTFFKRYTPAEGTEEARGRQQAEQEARGLLMVSLISNLVILQTFRLAVTAAPLRQP
jgi:hypothetical protein